MCAFVIVSLILTLPSLVLAAPGSGTAVIAPSGQVIAGSEGKWTITYTAAEAFSSGVVYLTIPAGWTMPQISNGTSAGYVTVTSEGTLEATPVVISGMAIQVYIDTLSTGETVDIVYGDDSVSSSGNASVQTTTEDAVAFMVSSDPASGSPVDLAASPAVDVVAASITELVFTTPPRTFQSDGESGVMRVEARDEFGNPSSVAGNQTIDLSSSSGGGSFSHLGGGSWSAVTSVTILSGEDTVSFYYRDTLAGTPDVTASAQGQSWVDPVQSVTVQPGDAVSLVVSPEDTTITAGEFARFLVKVVDANGNASPLSAAQTVTLLPASGNFYDKDDHGTTVSSITISSGSTSAEVDYSHSVMDISSGYFIAFFDTDGVSPSLEAAATTIYVDHSSADAATTTISLDKPTVTADGIDQVSVSVNVMDEYGNPVGGVAVVIDATDTGGGNDITQPVGVTGNDGIASGSLRSTVAEIKTISATIDGSAVTDTEAVDYVAGP
ncbi:MAG: Ig-like domain-containing protein, partial [Candidatus Krumholzibacteria bacterium]|nr:Ig-like domain-containing protein [Candidatus Krumholzibacteria bacterium]